MVGRDILELSVAQVPIDEARILESLADLVASNLGIDVTVDLHEVGPAIVVVVDEAAAPGHVLVIDADAGGESDVGESSVAVVVIKVAGIVGEVGLENIEPAVAVVIADGHAHAGLLVAILAVGASRHHGDVGESAVVVVVEQDAGLGVHRDVNIRPAVVIEIVETAVME